MNTPEFGMPTIKSIEELERPYESVQISYSRPDRTRRGEANQDVCVVDHKHALYGVLDGVGGYSGGDIAAQMSARVVRERAEHLHKKMTPSELALELRATLTAAHIHICAEQKRNPKVKEAATTATIVKIIEDDGVTKAVIAHIGDSRLYVFTKEGNLEQVTIDDSLYERYVISKLPPSEKKAARQRWNNIRDESELTEEEKTIPRNVITVGLGMKADMPPISTYAITVGEGDELWIFSDGITDNCTDRAIAAELSRPRTLQERTENLALLALRIAARGETDYRAKPDDTSIVSVKIHGKPRAKPLDARAPLDRIAAERPASENRGEFKRGDRVKILRSNGTIESNWEILNAMPGTQGQSFMAKQLGTAPKESLTKVVTKVQLEHWNR